MAIEVFNRFEHKYLLDKETYEKVIAVMDTHMEMDAHNKNYTPYTIANIYYDTEDDHLIRNSLSKPAYKEKLRLRSYGIPELSDWVFVEIKKKYNGIVNKRRTKLTLKDAMDFLASGTVPEYKPYMNGQVLKEISYFLKLYALEPKVYLAYDRIAYFEKNNPDLRISFDANIRARRYDLRPDLGDYGEPVLADELYLKESGDTLFSHTSANNFQCFIFSAAELEAGEDYTICVDGEEYETITATAGTASAGAATGGTGMGGGRGQMGGGRGQMNANPQVRVNVNGKRVFFDMAPIVKNDTTLVGFRAILETLGATVGWDEASQSVTAEKDGITILLVIGSTQAYVNGQEKTLLTAPEIINNSTMIPVRFISEQLGMKVDWDEANQLVSITEQ